MDKCKYIVLVYVHMHLHMHYSATHPAIIISSPTGKPVVKNDHQWQYRDIVVDFHTISGYKKNPTIQGLVSIAFSMYTYLRNILLANK